MRDFLGWSIGLGRWWGVSVRIHACFLLFAVCTLYLSTLAPARGAERYAAAALAILLVSVLLHEIGHALAAVRVGGSVDQIVLGPLGGLAFPHVPHEPQCERLTAVAGPMANGLICLLTAPLLLGANVSLPGLLSPLSPVEVVEGPTWLQGLKLTFWLNWLLLLVNLLPAFPMDGGRILRSILWPAFDYRAAVQILSVGAKLVAAGMLVAAIIFRNEFASPMVPAWVPLVLLAMILFFSAQHESSRLQEQELDDGMLSYDFSQGYTTLERTLDPPQNTLGPLRRRLEKWRAARRVRQRLLEQQEEREVDGILARLHESGMAGLSTRERELLERVSARYRSRQQSS